MRTRNVPALGVRYWSAISVASVFGANLGDFVSHDLHLGHVRGLPPLAAVFSAVLLLERRERAHGEAYYWLAIVTLRTAATNLADLATHDLRLGYGWVIAGLAALMVAALWWSSARSAIMGADTAGRLPATNGLYWLTMLIAGTLGTALGDAVADDLGLGVGLASGLLALCLAGLFALRKRAGFVSKSSYWVTIVGVRTTGTTMGDLVAHMLGLAPATFGTGCLLAAVLVVWKPLPGASIQRA